LVAPTARSAKQRKKVNTGPENLPRFLGLELNQKNKKIEEGTRKGEAGLKTRPWLKKSPFGFLAPSNNSGFVGNYLKQQGTTREKLLELTT